MASKKSTKAAPVDGRETFASIATKISDSQDVKATLKLLYALQKADSKIDDIHKLRGELPMEVEELNGEIEVLEAKIAAIQARIDASNVIISEADNKIVECDTLKAKYTEQLDSIANNREYDSLNKEIENIGLERRIAEKHRTEAKEDIIKDSEALAFQNEKLAVKQEDLSIKKGELDTIVENTAKEEEVCISERETLASQIDARTLSAYERVRGNYKNHLAVVGIAQSTEKTIAVSDDSSLERKAGIAKSKVRTVYSCGGCFNAISSQRLIEVMSNNKMIICEFCGRILVNPDNLE